LTDYVTQTLFLVDQQSFTATFKMIGASQKITHIAGAKVLIPNSFLPQIVPYYVAA
jgi:hypothetical protein